MNAPCKDCFDRKLLCHSQCEKYKAWKQQYDEMMAKRPEDVGWNPRALRAYWRDLRWGRNNR